MKQITCPACDATLAPESINIKEGVALCPSCGKLSRLAELVEREIPDPTVLTTSPKGCSYQKTLDGFDLAVSTASPGSAVFMLLFTGFWNSVLLVFLSVALSGLYANLIGPLPKWFPGVQGGTGGPQTNGHPMSLGESLFILLFLTPFILIGVGTLIAAIYGFFGRIVVSVAGSEGRIRNIAGPFHWTRRFDASDVQSISMGQTSYQVNNRHLPRIEIRTGEKTIGLCNGLRDDRMRWVLGSLTILLTKTA